jgi:hypothetical protein
MSLAMWYHCRCAVCTKEKHVLAVAEETIYIRIIGRIRLESSSRCTRWQLQKPHYGFINPSPASLHSVSRLKLFSNAWTFCMAAS